MERNPRHYSRDRVTVITSQPLSEGREGRKDNGDEILELQRLGHQMTDSWSAEGRATRKKPSSFTKVLTIAVGSINLWGRKGTSAFGGLNF